MRLEGQLKKRKTKGGLENHCGVEKRLCCEVKLCCRPFTSQTRASLLSGGGEFQTHAALPANQVPHVTRDSYSVLIIC